MGKFRQAQYNKQTVENKETFKFFSANAGVAQLFREAPENKADKFVGDSVVSHIVIDCICILYVVFATILW